METYWLGIGLFVLGYILGHIARRIDESHNHQKHSIPPSTPLDELRQMCTLVAGKEVVGACRSRKSIPRQRHRIVLLDDEKEKLHLAKKLRKSHHPEGDSRWMPKSSGDISNVPKPQGTKSC